MEAFLILEIEQTKDEAAIKAAYYKKLKTVNPEDDQEGFMRLRKAYEDALKYAKTPEEEVKEQEEDTTPSGQWVKKAAAIYERLSTRRDLAKWEELFDDDVFLSLEEEELCREKLLVFLMDHIYLPTKVWNLIDEKIHILNGDKKLFEKFPREFINYCEYKCRQGETIDFDLFTAEDDLAVEQYIGCYDKGYRMLDQDEIAAARTVLEEGKSLAIYHPYFEVFEMHLLHREEKVEELHALRDSLLERYPDNELIVFQTAEIALKLEEKDFALKLYEKLKADMKKHYMANLRLSYLYHELGRDKEAKKCAEVILGYGAGPEFRDLLTDINKGLREGYKETSKTNPDDAMEYGWCLLQDDAFFECMKLAEDLEGKVSPERETERKGLVCKTFLQAARVQESLDMALIWRDELLKRMPEENEEDYKEDIRRVKDSYFIRIQGYRMLGYADKTNFDKALSEIEELIAFVEDKEPGQQKDPAIFLEKAHILLDAERYDECDDVCFKVWDEYQLEVVFSILLKLASKRRDAGGVVQFGNRCIAQYPEYALAYEEMALVYLCLEKKEELEDILAKAKEAGVKSVFLDAYEYQHRNGRKEINLGEVLKDFNENYKSKIVEDGEIHLFEQAEKMILEYFYLAPSNYMLNEVGRFYMDTLHFDKAEMYFEKLLSEDPGDQFGYNNLGCIYKYTERYDKALVCFRKAMLYMDDEPNTYPYGNMGHTYERMGEFTEAALVYLQLAERFPERKNSSIRDIVTCLSRSGQHKRAIAYLDEHKDDDFSEMRRCYIGALVCLGADDKIRAGAYLQKFRELLGGDNGDTVNHVRYLELHVQYLLLYGEYNYAVEQMQKHCKKVIKLAKEDKMSFMEVGQDYADTLFYLTMYYDAYGQNMSGETKKAGVFDSLKTVFGKSNASSVNVGTGASFGIQLSAALEKVIADHHNDREDVFLYSHKELWWMRFMVSYWKRDGKLEEIFAELEKCNICRGCSENICLQMHAAKALLLEHKGEKEKAKEAYAEIGRLDPFDNYGRIRLRFWKE